MMIGWTLPLLCITSPSTVPLHALALYLDVSTLLERTHSFTPIHSVKHSALPNVELGRYTVRPRRSTVWITRDSHCDHTGKTLQKLHTMYKQPPHCETAPTLWNAHHIVKIDTVVTHYTVWNYHTVKLPPHCEIVTLRTSTVWHIILCEIATLWNSRYMKYGDVGNNRNMTWRALKRVYMRKTWQPLSLYLPIN